MLHGNHHPIWQSSFHGKDFSIMASSLPNIDKRKHDRIRHGTQVDFSDGTLFLSGDIVDISLGGMQIECIKGLDKGTEITIAIPMSAGLKLRGVVRWERKQGIKHFLGVQFLNVSPEQESGIREVIQSLFWKTAKA